MILFTGGCTGRHPPRTRPPRRDTPQDQTPPQVRHPPCQTPSGQTPPMSDTPPGQTPPGQNPPRICTSPKNKYTLRNKYTPKNKYTPPKNKYTHRDTVNTWMVCILLECNLVHYEGRRVCKWVNPLNMITGH